VQKKSRESKDLQEYLLLANSMKSIIVFVLKMSFMPKFSPGLLDSNDNQAKAYTSDEHE